MSNHTPGPWTAEFHGSVWHIEEGSGVQLSCVYVWTEDDGEKEAAANARLIAAAPELFDVASRLAEWGRGGMTISELGGAIHDAVAAIDKTTQEEA